MALQPKIIACGNSVASFAMAVRFLTGPAVMAAASIAVGLRGTLLHVAIVQVTPYLSFIYFSQLVTYISFSDVIYELVFYFKSLTFMCHDIIFLFFIIKLLYIYIYIL